MELDLQKELNNIEEAKKELNAKILSYFVNKWVLGKDTRRYFGNEGGFAKTKKGEYICFKVDSARLKSVKLASDDLASEIVLSGKDSRGAIRSLTIQRLYQPDIVGSNEPDTFEYDVDFFETEEEAILFATLKDQVDPKRF